MNWVGIFIACFVVFVLLVISELGWRKGWLRGEFGRKFVHISVGTFVALWPFFIDWQEIRVLSLLFFFGVVLSFRLGLFKAVHTYQRPTYGEVLFALSVGFLTLITDSKGIYTAAILQMSLADGLAAVAGTYWGKSNQYTIFGRAKSLVGTLTFLMTSILILTGYALYSDGGLAWLYLPGVAITATAIENLAVLGMDNLLVPAVVGVILRAVSQA